MGLNRDGRILASLVDKTIGFQVRAVARSPDPRRRHQVSSKSDCREDRSALSPVALEAGNGKNSTEVFTDSLK
jgi:hypothetical protein